MKIIGAAIIALMLTTGAAQAQDAGAKDFKNHCAACHKVEKVIGFTKKRTDAKERTAWLEKKLAKHNAPDAAQRARIIAYLEAQRGSSK